jgi:hypothetical protein
LTRPSLGFVLKRKRAFKGWTCAVVDVDLSELGDKAARINITCRSESSAQSTRTRAAAVKRARDFLHERLLMPCRKQPRNDQTGPAVRCALIRLTQFSITKGAWILAGDVIGELYCHHAVRSVTPCNHI